MDAERTPDDRRVDAALLHTLWTRSALAPREDCGDRLRQMKLAFLAAYRLRTAGSDALHLSFYGWTWGPMSNEVCDAWHDLAVAGLVQDEERMAVTRRGLQLAKEFYDEVLKDERNAPVRDVVDMVAKEWADQPATGELLAFVNELPIAHGGMERPQPAGTFEKGDTLLSRIDPDAAQHRLHIGDDWLETLALVFDPGAASSLRAGIADFRSGRVVA